MTRRRAINTRSIILGLAGVFVICAITPFNNFVVNNTNLIGSFLPVGVLLLELVLIIANALVRRFAPTKALNAGELGVILAMMLVAATIPGVGLMRQLPGHLVTFWHESAVDHQVARLMREMQLADWLFPSMQAQDPQLRGMDPVVRDFIGRVPAEDAKFLARFAAVPWAAWAKPAVAWGILLACLYGMTIGVVALLHEQWAVHERLAFPLASVHLALIADPEPGRSFNALLRSPAFWITAAAIFAIHAINGLAVYFPRQVPPIPVAFSLSSIFSEHPWLFMDGAAKQQTIYFSIIGICFFIRSNRTLSMWVCFLIYQVALMVMGTHQSELSGGKQTDQQLGAILVVFALILWTARHHLKSIGRAMVTPGASTHGRYGSYRVLGWSTLLAAVGACTWLVLAGMSLTAAISIILAFIVVVVVLARIVAETGLPYASVPVEFNRPWMYLASSFPETVAARTTLPSYFFASFLHGVFTQDTREALPPYASQALRINDAAAEPGQSRMRGLVPVLLLALLVGYIVAGASMLYSEYSYAATLDRTQQSPINWWGAVRMPRYIAIDRTLAYQPPGVGGYESHSHWFHLGLGGTIAGVMGYCSLRFVAWPLHPVGFLLVYTWGFKQVWFSVFLGWLAKSLIVRYGGARLLKWAQPVFLGLIVAEAAAAAFWLLVSLAWVAAGWEFRPVRLLPG